MISGRGLGITGGTLDKLDSIPGFKTLLPAEKIVAQVQKIGCVICGQTDRMVPADKKLYALRDVSGTVPSIPLITASILSKKLAESLDALVLDVKFGCAAFMQTRADARKLAKAMVALGNECGVNTRAILTDMNTPLGRAAGNWLEVKESVACLESRAGVSPARADAVGAKLFRKNCSRWSCSPGRRDARPTLRRPPRTRPRLRCPSAGSNRQSQIARRRAQTGRGCLASGAPRKKWDEMLVAQGADLDAFNKKLALDHTAPVVVGNQSGPQPGFVSKCDARLVGEVIRDLGGGRLTKESAINYDVGVDRLAKPGERVEKSATLCRVHAADRARAKASVARLKSAFEISPRPPAVARLVHAVI